MVRNKIIITLLLCIGSLNAFGFEDCAVVCKYHFGRFGNNLTEYLKAKWYCHENDLPFIYTPFSYSKELGIHKFEKHYNKQEFQHFTKIPILKKKELQKHKNEHFLLFEIAFRSQAPDLYVYALSHPQFDAEIKKMLQPIDITQKLEFPKNSITVALHVRKGSAFDTPIVSQQQYDGYEVSYILENKSREKIPSDIQFPSKFPPDQFFIDFLSPKKIITNYQLSTPLILSFYR